MPNDHVKQEIQRLRADLEAIEANEDPTPQEIAELLKHVKSTVQASDDETDSQNLLNYLNDSLEQFEANHPTLMGRITVIMQGLSESGI